MQRSITLHGREYVERVVADRFGDRLALMRFKERAWDGHQDVWTYQRVRSDVTPGDSSPMR